MRTHRPIRTPRWSSIPWILVLLCVSCASFSEPRLPARSLATFEGDARLPAITYNVSAAGVQIDATSAVMARAPVMISALESRLEPIFRRAFMEARRQEEPGEWHVDIYYRETERNPAVTYTLALLFIASLGLVPAYGQTDLYLEAKLVHAGGTVRQRIYEERISMWAHWLVLPWAFSRDPVERKAALIDNMVLNLVGDLAADLGSRQ